MKTLADFKRALQPDTKWHATNANHGDLGIGTVSILQSNAVAFKREGRENLTWLTFPKASEFEINERGEAEIYWPACEVYEKPRRLILTYRQVS